MLINVYHHSLTKTFCTIIIIPVVLVRRAGDDYSNNDND